MYDLSAEDIEAIEQMAAGPPSLTDWLDELEHSAAEAHAEAATLRAQYEWQQDTPAIDDMKRRLRMGGAPPAAASAAAAAVRLSGNAQQAQRYVAALELSSKGPSDAELAQAVEEDGMYDALKSRIRVPGAPRVAAQNQLRTPSPYTVQPSPAQGLGSPMARSNVPKTTAGDAFVNRPRDLPRTAPPSNAGDPYPGLYSQLRSQVIAGLR